MIRWVQWPAGPHTSDSPTSDQGIGAENRVILRPPPTPGLLHSADLSEGIVQTKTHLQVPAHSGGRRTHWGMTVRLAHQLVPSCRGERSLRRCCTLRWSFLLVRCHGTPVEAPIYDRHTGSGPHRPGLVGRLAAYHWLCPVWCRFGALRRLRLDHTSWLPAALVRPRYARCCWDPPARQTYPPPPRHQ